MTTKTEDRLRRGLKAALELRAQIEDLAPEFKMLSVARTAVAEFDETWEKIKSEVSHKAIQTSAASTKAIEGRKGVRAPNGAGNRKIKGGD